MLSGTGDLYFLSFRPPRSRMCRTRRLCQGQALTSRSAALDIRRLASGCTFLRATDVNASGGSSVNEHHINTKGTKSRKAFFLLSGIFTLPSSFSPAYPLFCFPVCHSSASVIALRAFAYAPRTELHAFPIRSRLVLMAHRMRPRRVPHAGIIRFCVRADVMPFVRHHPGKPAYVRCTRADARYTSRLAGGSAPSTPGSPAASSGLCKGKRRVKA